MSYQVLIFLVACSCINTASAQFEGGLLSGAVIILGSTVLMYQSSVVDICRAQNLFISIDGAHGTVGLGNYSTYPQNPCVLRIEACAYCYITVELSGNDFSLDTCFSTSPSHSASNCTKGCEYLYIFDGFYLEDTIQFYSNSYNSVPRFDSLSSIMYIAFCNNGKPRDIQLTYTTKPKWYYISDVEADKGTIRSLNFPKGYVQSGEQITYFFSNSGNTQKQIMITFDDWDLSYASEIYFDNSNFHMPVTGDSYRPVVKSDGSEMKVIFNVGRDLIGGGRRYMGFKFSYMFYDATQDVPAPLTNCGEYLLSSNGGTIHQSFKRLVSMKLYDCIWVVKAQPGYDNVFLKLISFRAENTAEYIGDPNHLEIRDGLTSDGHLLKRIYPNYTVTYPHSFSSSKGFHIRLRGQFKSIDKLDMTYTSSSYGSSGCSQFLCKNQRCIPSKLACDQYDHCGDSSDETNGCSHGIGGPTASSHYNLTISVIIPMVISILLLIILCVLFFLIRRCRKAREQELARSRDIPSVCGQVQRGGRRRRGPRSYERPAQYPPTYEEALRSPPYEEPAMENWEIGPDGLPKPPSYEDAIGVNIGVEIPSRDINPSSTGEISPSTSNSTETDASTQTGRRTVSSSDSSATEERRPSNHTYSMSYSSDSSVDISPALSPAPPEYQTESNVQSLDTPNTDSRGSLKSLDINTNSENTVGPGKPENKQTDPSRSEDHAKSGTKNSGLYSRHPPLSVRQIGENSSSAKDSNGASQLRPSGPRATDPNSLLRRLADIQTRLGRDPHKSTSDKATTQLLRNPPPYREQDTRSQNSHHRDHDRAQDGEQKPETYAKSRQDARLADNRGQGPIGHPDRSNLNPNIGSTKQSGREPPKTTDPRSSSSGREPASDRRPKSHENHLRSRSREHHGNQAYRYDESQPCSSDKENGNDKKHKYDNRLRQRSRSSSSELLFSDRHFAPEDQNVGHQNMGFKDSQEFLPVSSSTPRLNGAAAASLGNLMNSDLFVDKSASKERAKSLQNLPRAECRTFTTPQRVNAGAEVTQPASRSLTHLNQRGGSVPDLPRESSLQTSRQHVSEPDFNANASPGAHFTLSQSETISEDVFV